MLIFINNLSSWIILQGSSSLLWVIVSIISFIYKDYKAIWICLKCLPPSGCSGTWPVIHLFIHFLTEQLLECYLGSDPCVCSLELSPGVHKKIYRCQVLKLVPLYDLPITFWCLVALLSVHQTEIQGFIHPALLHPFHSYVSISAKR